MTLEIGFVLALTVLALILFAWEGIGVDVAAGIIMALLLLSGLITPAQGLAGFSNSATVTVTAMFVLSAGLTQTGALAVVGDWLAEIGKESPPRALAALMGTVAVISAFINNTAAVAIFLPIVLDMSRRIEVSPSRLLMPLSFASIFGGTCTLIGTSTNILVDSIAQEEGLQAFGMFEFAPVGLAFFAVGFAYLFWVGVDLIPERRPVGDLTASFEMKAYLTDVLLRPESPAVGETIEDTTLLEDLDVDILEVFRTGEERPDTEADPVLRPNDVLRVRGAGTEIDELLQREDIMLQPSSQWQDLDLELGEDVLVEAVVLRNSELVNRRIGEVDFPEQFGGLVLAVRHRGELQQEALPEFRLSGGDELLLKVDRERLPQLRESPALVLASEESGEEERPEKIWIALTIIAAVVGLAAFGFFPIVVTAVSGAIAMVLAGVITSEDAYAAIQWDVVFLLGGILSLGKAMEATGAAQYMATHVLEFAGALGPRAVLAGLLVLTMGLTNVISNNAAAVLLAPIAIEMAGTMGVDPKPFLMGITYAASLAFLSPVGYQTNTLIYGPGQYRFTDFARVGTALSVLFLGVAILLIPVVWPF